MSRWGKSGIQKFALPLDALVKEKENTNRPIAARSAGTVGKWGITSFTSIRGPSYAFSSFSPKQDNATAAGNPNISPHSTDGQNTPSRNSGGGACGSDFPKPKKFFKSRNVAPVDFMTAQQQHLFTEPPPSSIQSVSSGTGSATPKLSLKINKKLLKHDDAKKPRHDKPKPKKKSKVKEADKFKSEEQPTRVLPRARKAVNYIEENSRSPSPLNFDLPESPPMEIVEPVPSIKIPSVFKSTMQSISPPPHPTPPPPSTPIAQPTMQPQSFEPEIMLDEAPKHRTDGDGEDEKDSKTSATCSKNVGHDHPPIVLRISKGTSRLVSTDSEDINSSPYVSPKPIAAAITTTTCGALSSTADLLAVLTDDSPSLPQINATHATAKEPPTSTILTVIDSQPIKLEPVPAPPPPPPPPPVAAAAAATVSEIRPEGIKIKIKKLAKAFVASNDKIAKREVINKRPPLRKSRRNQQALLKSQAAKMASPQPGSENYDLYRTLTASPSDKDFDSQSSILGSVSSNFAADIPEDSRVIHSRGSSDVTSDQDTSQDSSLVAPPSEMDLQLAAMMECDTEPTTISQTNSIKIDATDTTKLTNNEVKRSPTPPPAPLPPPPPPPKVEKIIECPKQIPEGRVTRNKNGITQKTSTAEPERLPLVTRSYGRKRKPVSEKTSSNNNSAALPIDTNDTFDDRTIDTTLLPASIINQKCDVVIEKLTLPPSINDTVADKLEYKVSKKIRKIEHNPEHDENHMLEMNDVNCENVNNNSEGISDEKPSVKLVISKKKGSIFKSRAIDADAGNDKKPKRHLYKHKWDDNSKEKVSPSDSPEKVTAALMKQYCMNEFEDGETSAGMVRVTRQQRSSHDDDDEITSVKCNTKVKKFYTVVRNVKKAHQIQEIGEFQEMDDDIEYILDAMQPHNKMSTRCLSAIQLASKCMTPAFRMHVRAHGTITKFFKSLIDAAKDQSLGLCTATVMFVLNQDNLNMDLDRDSLELMLNLLESDVSHKNALDDCGLTRDQLQRNKQKVKELCTEIKNHGKAVHLNLDNITVGTLAMETLLSLTSKRAGEWFKEELRKLGGLEHIIKTICECCRQISDYVVDWTESLLEKLRKIERCLRVLENVSQENEENQTYILSYENGHAVDTLLKFYKLCDSEITLYPTVDGTPKENPGVVLREALVPTIKVLINLTHPFNTNAFGSGILGRKPMVFDTSLHLLLEAHNYVPESCIFDISILVLLLLINLTMYTLPNRTIIMEASAPSDFRNKFIKVSAVKALIEYFHKCEELAKLVEKNTDDILNNPDKSDGKKSQEEVDETVTKLLQKAGHHMEHTMLASYVCLLIGHLIMDNESHQTKIRTYLKDGQFTDMVQILEKYYNFMNLTASSASSTVEHIKQTKMIIEYLRNSDLHSNDSNKDDRRCCGDIVKSK